MPVLQCLQIKQLPPQPPSPDRYRMIVSDGRFFCYGMLATQSNHITLNNGVPSNSLVRLKSYQANAVRGKQ
jgi:replication factor A1